MSPGMDGLKRTGTSWPCIPGQKGVIASGYAETERVKAAQRLGAGVYVKKPYTLEKIGLSAKAELGSVTDRNRL